MNQDGRSSSLTTPNGASQQNLLRAAAFQAQVVGSLQSAMLHGTATPLGDPIEVAALTAVYGGVNQRQVDGRVRVRGAYYTRQ